MTLAYAVGALLYSIMYMYYIYILYHRCMWYIVVYYTIICTYIVVVVWI